VKCNGGSQDKPRVAAIEGVLVLGSNGVIDIAKTTGKLLNIKKLFEDIMNNKWGTA
jgi:hypothetical protein